MKIVLTRIYEKYSLEMNTPAVNRNKLIEEICIYIDENAREISSGKVVADKFSYHSYYINRLMVKYKECTLHEYIINAKIRKSIEYLTNSNYTISQIAELCGFFDSSHFSRNFKEIMGCTPSKYRYI